MTRLVDQVVAAHGEAVLLELGVMVTFLWSHNLEAAPSAQAYTYDLTS